MAHSDQLKIYKRRNPQTTSLWKLLNCHFVEFEECYDKLFQKKYGFYRLVISRVVRKYLECGDLHQGFARIKCPDCHHEFILAFSCRGRWFCPSCHNKKVVQFGHHLKETILYPVPHRQYVFSIPKILRRFFLYDRKVLGKLSQCAAKSLTKFLKTILGKKHGIPGLVVSIQTFGDYARWHPHLHVLVADGLFLESGYFFVMPKVDLRPLRELFRGHLLKMLKKEGLIDDAFIRMIMKWRHTSGFNVHNQVRIKPDDEKEGKIFKDGKVIDIRSYQPKRIPQLMWRECIKKVWEVDPLTCPKSTGEMKIISFIYKRAIIKKILTHLKLYEERSNQRAPPATPQYIVPTEIVAYDDGWPGYEESGFDFLKVQRPSMGMLVQNWPE